MKRKPPETKEVWIGRIEGWRASGKPQKEYCSEQGFNRNTMVKWISTLNQENKKIDPKSEKTEWIELTKREPMDKTPITKISYNGFEIEMVETFSEPFLIKLLRVMKKVC